MVQIRRQRHVYATTSRIPQPCCTLGCVSRWMQWLLMTALIPSLFLVRLYYFSSTTSTIASKQQQHDSLRTTTTTITNDAESLSNKNEEAAFESDASFSAPSLDSVWNQPDFFDFLQTIDYAIYSTTAGSHSNWIELAHCHLPLMDAAEATFIAWAQPLLNHTLTSLTKRQMNTQPPLLFPMESDWVAIAQTLTLQLLEIHVTAPESKVCDWNAYKPTVPTTPEIQSVSQRLVHSMNGKKQIGVDKDTTVRDMTVQLPEEEEEEEDALRIVFVIIAYQDVVHLQRLVQALQAPTHWIVIHIEDSAPPDFVQAVQRISREYPRVFVVQFGVVVYETDSVSMIHWRILQWLHHDLRVSYDYHVTLDGASYPLFTAQGLNAYLQSTLHPIYLGELWHQGRSASGYSQEMHWRHKRLVLTHSPTTSPLYKSLVRLPRNAMGTSSIPEALQEHIQYKSTSGNQGIYHTRVIQELLQGATVRHLWALSKYGCCCCIEERAWIAAFSYLGYRETAQSHPALFQVWGGGTLSSDGREPVCTGGDMHNAVLSQNASTCFRLEQAALVQNLLDHPDDMATLFDPPLPWEAPPYTVHGSHMLSLLRVAKTRAGYIFARKFTTTRADSLALLDAIEAQIWPLAGPKE
jgi:hypothetical protein